MRFEEDEEKSNSQPIMLLDGYVEPHRTCVNFPTLTIGVWCYRSYNDGKYEHSRGLDWAR